MQKSDVQTKNTLKIEILRKRWRFRYSRIRCLRACSILLNSVGVNYAASKMKYVYAYFIIFGTLWNFP